MHSHDPSNSVMAGKHEYVGGEYKAVDEKKFKADAYPRYKHTLDAAGQPISKLVADPEEESALEGKWYNTPAQAMRAAKEPVAPKA